MSSTLLLKGGTVVTMNARREVFGGDVLVSDGIVTAVGESLEPRQGEVDRVMYLRDCYILPGFIQTHVHLCQTLFRGRAEGVGLDKWLEQIWALEASHDARSMYYSAMLSCCELLRSGTTCVLDMGSVYHTDEVFEALTESGIRAFCGKAMMDSGDKVPLGLRESTRQSLEESLNLFSRWDGVADGRIRYALAPRFLESCSEGLLRTVAEKARELNVLIHSHASETEEELAVCKAQRGMSPLGYLHSIGLTGPNLVLAHCVHLESADFEILSETGTSVSHCPSSNLKLSSGIADIGRMIRSGVRVSLGCDGAACNNNLEVMGEMRLAALLQLYLNRDVFPWPALFLEAVTIGGAEALGVSDSIGSIEPGKRADIIAIDVSGAHTFCGQPCEPSTKIVFSAKGSDVKAVMVDGRVLFENGCFSTLDEEKLVAKSSEESKKLLARCS